MIAILIIGIIYTVYGTIRAIQKHKRKSSWEQEYLKCCGKADLLKGIPGIIIFIISQISSMESKISLILFIIFAIPSFIYKYKFMKRLRKQEENS